MKWDSGITKPIPIERGSIQGDTLSPFLFLVYVEPLLRWLHVGARGYKFGSVDENPSRVANSLSSCTYADDLNAPTNSLSDLKLQAGKVSLYSDWASMPVNTTKTICTGILYRNVVSGLYGIRDATTAVRRQLEGQILIQGQPVSYKEPTEPFTSLGVELTLDWKFQHRALTRKLREKIEHLNSSFATPQQKQRILRTTIEPSITYAFSVTPLTPNRHPMPRHPDHNLPEKSPPPPYQLSDSFCARRYCLIWHGSRLSCDVLRPEACSRPD